MISRFFDYVEIKTKITSVFPFLLGSAFIVFKGYEIKTKETLVFFLAMFLFDLTTTAINNYVDTKTNEKPLPYSRKRALAIIYILFVVSAGLGLILVALTDWIVLFLGGLSFISGVLYTYGPVPISRLPFGELFSGIFYGLMIPFILFYFNMPEGYFFDLSIKDWGIYLNIQIWPTIELLLLSVAPIMCTANIMLANNICDLEEDIAVKRHTLPYYVGDKALKLFRALYYLVYLAVIAMLVLKMVHPMCALSLLTIVPVEKNIRVFLKTQNKKTTFHVSIENYILIMASFVVTVWLSIWFK